MSATPDGPLEDLGSWRGHWDGTRLTFTPIDQRAESSGVKPQGFVELNDARLGVWTDEAIVVNSACPHLKDEANYYFTSGVRRLSNNSTCPDGHLCALISLENETDRDVFSTYLQVTSITPADFTVTTPRASIPTGYPLDATHGLWRYGDLRGNRAGGQREWRFSLPTCDDFIFNVKVMGTLLQDTYTASGDSKTSDGQSVPWIDACQLPGHTRVLTNAGPGSYVDGIALPFPFTFYDFVFDTDEAPILTISANGALGALPAETGSQPLPGDNVYMMYPFWDQLQLGPDGVCYATVGSAPTRRFVATWHKADIVGTAATEELTFSAVLHESTDRVEFLYDRWSDNPSNCKNSDESRGSRAIIGIQGVDEATVWSNQEPTLPRRALPSLPCLRYIVEFTPYPGNQL